MMKIVKIFCVLLICSGLVACGVQNKINVSDVNISDIENGRVYQEIIYPNIEFKGNSVIKTKINVINIKAKNDAEKFAFDGKEMVRKEVGDTNNEYMKYSYVSNVDIMRNDSKYLSFMTSTYEFLGGAHGFDVIKCYNFDAKTGNDLSIYDLMSDRNKLRAKLIKGVEDKYKEHLSSDYVDVIDNYLDGEEELNFVIAYDGVKVIFQEYEIIPRVDGVAEVNIGF